MYVVLIFLQNKPFCLKKHQINLYCSQKLKMMIWTLWVEDNWDFISKIVFYMSIGYKTIIFKFMPRLLFDVKTCKLVLFEFMYVQPLDIWRQAARWLIFLLKDLAMKIDTKFLDICKEYLYFSICDFSEY